ncbi:Interferon-induced guanylate-binding protein 2 [Monoraphidium neglectum]|uniref:Interferon-induced guanylate-binding protein 2 n=1 Tax=Monoraphidium neglectum TaxID=145388 RepID=A0A0D2MSV7_9CHLO|nr:Interferon-induced guanylate-binding protein 2 [Monoraphidium neglectum]KIZ05610.1 Interferon-induced guanylate-binding protein 2 [Monoraphidium neglectum]|eukprot:XP_013904629.1 Interferon-induced guanylate-binding protein 2 [Monoraphidium neglectum]
MPGAAVELIRYNAETRRFEVGPLALDVLRATTTPVAVVAVCGRARQGKSFILNQLLSVTAGFQIGSTHRPCTKGLWMWSTPQARTDADGNPYHLVLLDTEGIDAYDQTAQYSTQIFSLAVLLSSLFVYNQMGGIDEAALDRLSLVVEMSKHIKVRSGATHGANGVSSGGDGSAASSTAGAAAGGDDAAARELRRFTPSFLWLLRDFYLKLEDEHGRKVTAREYLEAALTPVAGGGAGVDAKNAIRSSIKGLFPDRDCATLVRPMHEEQALVSLDTTPREELRPEFKEGVAWLLRLILLKAQPKRLGGFVLTGPVLAGLTEAYVAAINDGAGVAEQECRRAADAAEATYRAEFDEAVVAEEPELEREHTRALTVAKGAFAAVAIGEWSIRRANEARFLDACAARFAQVRARKLAEAAASVNDLLLSASSALAAAATTPAAASARNGGGGEGADPEAGPEPASSAAEVEAQLSRFLDGYASSACGPTKWPKLIEFMKHTYPALARGAAAAAEERGRLEARRLQAELDCVRAEAAAAGARGDGLARQLVAAEAQAEASGRRAAEQAAELADLRVALERERSKALLLEGHLTEAQLIAEKRLLCAQQESEARARAEAEQHGQQAVALGAQAAEERRRAEALSAEVVCELRSQVEGLTGQLAAAQDEAASYLSSFGGAKQEQAALQRALEEASAEITGLRLAGAAAARVSARTVA